jgi:LuxR family maltose regulon positive regulatory protein
MATPVLVTKLFIPTARPRAVARPHLMALLNEGQDKRLTLVSAPAGFGKTTLIAEWVHGLEVPIAWVSLDESDNDPASFLTYLIAGLQTVAPGLGVQLLQALQSAQPPSIESVLVALLNEVNALPEPVVLVLDDYHATDAAAVDAALAFLIEHQTRKLRLVICTRQDPDLPVARLRARGQLIELRAADLRFTAAEAADYLHSVMGLSLSGEDVALLEQRTEGWIAGLQLAALSMRGHHDVSGFINAFAGDHRYIADYLVGEVLGRQPKDIRRFLLQTAVLDRMTGSLCDAVTGQQNGSLQLEALERGNYFVVPLDENRQWYRYHHLFAEVLRAYLAEEQPDHVSTLHRRASDWYDRTGAPADAIRHALSAQDFERAAELIEFAVPAMHRIRHEATALAWFRALPEALFRRRPMLSAFYAATLLVSGELEDVEKRLQEAERWLEPPTHTEPGSAASSDGMVVMDAAGFRNLPASIAMWRSGLALSAGHLSETERYARLALELVGDDDHQLHGSAAALQGLAAWSRGDLDRAFVLYAEGRDRLRVAGFLTDAVGCAVTLADIRIAQGRLRDAMAIYQEGLELATNSGSAILRGAADMHVGMCELHRQRGDLSAAAAELACCDQLGETLGFPQHPYRWRAAKAHMHQAEGDFAGAVELLDAAERVYANDFSPKVRPVGAMRTRVWLKEGRLAEALRWVRDQGVSTRDELSYVREFEHITLARVVLAQYTSDRAVPAVLAEAMDLLGRLLHAADAGAREGSVIEILVLQSLAQEAAGDVLAALVPLSRALTLAEGEGYARVFLDEGRPMSALLEAAAHQGSTQAYARALLAGSGRSGHIPRPRQPLIQPLSGRELDVLRLLCSDLDGPAIARELVVSLHTVRSHTKNIYSKLGVTNRRAAVRQAEELDLLSVRRDYVG